MKKAFQHIALVLLAIFTVTFVPFNALHHHAEDEHAAFVHAHRVDEKHHCELDNHFCETDLDIDCGHESHIQNTLDKCFACEFHFIKHFEKTQSCENFIRENSPIAYTIFVSEKLRQAIVLISNKGPPRLV